jgi:hypothetical protein
MVVYVDLYGPHLNSSPIDLKTRSVYFFPTQLLIKILVAHFSLVIMRIVICKMLISIGGHHTDFLNVFSKCY